MEGVGPELHAKVRASEHSTNGIFDGPMRTFAEAILRGHVGGGRFNSVARGFEQIQDAVAAAKLRASIKTYVTVPGDGRMGGEPLIEPINGRLLGFETRTVEGVAEVILNEEIADLPIAPLYMFEAILVLTALYHETIVNGETLEALGGLSQAFFARGPFDELVLDAKRALGNLVGMAQPWDSFGMLVHVTYSSQVDMAKAVVP